jgi:hypothetical protein
MVQDRLAGSIRWSKVEPEFGTLKHALHLRDPGVQSDQPYRYGCERCQALQSQGPTATERAPVIAVDDLEHGAY